MLLGNSDLQVAHDTPLGLCPRFDYSIGHPALLDIPAVGTRHNNTA